MPIIHDVYCNSLIVTIALFFCYIDQIFTNIHNIVTKSAKPWELTSIYHRIDDNMSTTKETCLRITHNPAPGHKQRSDHEAALSSVAFYLPDRIPHQSSSIHLIFRSEASNVVLRVMPRMERKSSGLKHSCRLKPPASNKKLRGPGHRGHALVKV